MTRDQKWSLPRRSNYIMNVIALMQWLPKSDDLFIQDGCRKAETFFYYKFLLCPNCMTGNIDEYENYMPPVKGIKNLF